MVLSGTFGCRQRWLSPLCLVGCHVCCSLAGCVPRKSPASTPVASRQLVSAPSAAKPLLPALYHQTTVACQNLPSSRDGIFPVRLTVVSLVTPLCVVGELLGAIIGSSAAAAASLLPAVVRWSFLFFSRKINFSVLLDSSLFLLSDQSLDTFRKAFVWFPVSGKFPPSFPVFFASFRTFFEFPRVLRVSTVLSGSFLFQCSSVFFGVPTGWLSVLTVWWFFWRLPTVEGFWRFGGF